MIPTSRGSAAPSTDRLFVSELLALLSHGSGSFNHRVDEYRLSGKIGRKC